MTSLASFFRHTPFVAAALLVMAAVTVESWALVGVNPSGDAAGRGMAAGFSLLLAIAALALYGLLVVVSLVLFFKNPAPTVFQQVVNVVLWLPVPIVLGLVVVSSVGDSPPGRRALAAEDVVARVDGSPVYRAQVAELTRTDPRFHVSVASFDSALEEVIGRRLIVEAAHRNGLTGDRSEDIERKLVALLEFDVPAVALELGVNHAWLKDASSPEEQARQEEDFQRFHREVEKGGSFLEAFKRLGLDGQRWHVADDETYQGAVFPPAVAKLPEGRLSEPFRSAGGMSLVRILRRTGAERPSAEAVHEVLVDRLSLRARIERCPEGCQKP